VTASAAVTLEELAPGRVVVGVGTGGSARRRWAHARADRAHRHPRGDGDLDPNASRSGRRSASRAAPRGVCLAARGPAHSRLRGGSGPRMLETAGRVATGSSCMRGWIRHPACRTHPRGAGARASGRTHDDLDVASGPPSPSRATAPWPAIMRAGAWPPLLRHPLPVPFQRHRPAPGGAPPPRVRRLPARGRRPPAIASWCPTDSVDLMANAGTPERCGRR
jgi:hypothetical protein